MGAFEERGQLITEFLSFAGRVQRLHDSDPQNHPHGTDLARWLSLYRSEIDDVLRHQRELTDRMTAPGVTSERLTQWIEDSRQVLSTAGNDW